jgi:hypothetical protein
MAADLDERRVRFLAGLLPLNAPQLRVRQQELMAKPDKTVDEDEEVKLLEQVLTMLARNKVPEERSLGSWIVEELLEADPT